MILEIWVKPSGVEVQINAESRDAARELGWVPKDSVPVMMDQPKRRGRPPKAKED
jgi:hypothetical protein